MKTAVEEYLDTQNVPYQQYDFSRTAADRNARMAAAAELGVADKIFKTLVLKGNKSGVIIALVPLESRLDYKKVAVITGDHKVGLPPIEQVLEYTGYPKGANTPVGIFQQHPEYQFIFDDSMKSFDTILVSSGVLGYSIEVAVKDLLALIQPRIAVIVK